MSKIKVFFDPKKPQNFLGRLNYQILWSIYTVIKHNLDLWIF